MIEIPEIAKPGYKEGKNPFFIHIHIPKTGGTTFNKLLEKNFNNSFEQFAGRFIYLFPKFSIDQIINFIELHSVINCVASHNFTAILPYQFGKRKIVGVAFLRDPIDTFLSLYFHLRHRGGNFIESQKNLDDYIELKTKNIRSIDKKGFLKVMTGYENKEAFKYIKLLVENRNLFLFDTNRMQNSYDILCDIFPDYFARNKVTKENISKKDQNVTEIQRNKIKGTVSDFDWKLLDLANKNMDSLYQK